MMHGPININKEKCLLDLLAVKDNYLEEQHWVFEKMGIQKSFDCF